MTFEPSLSDPPLQEILLRWPRWRDQDSPWRMLSGCVMLNASNRRAVDRAWPEFFSRWPTPMAVIRATFGELEDVLRPTGCQRRKADLLGALAEEWFRCYPRLPQNGGVQGFAGCGPYAQESWDAFVDGLNLIDAVDDVIRPWCRLREEQGLSEAAVDCAVISTVVRRFGLDWSPLHGPEARA